MIRSVMLSSIAIHLLDSSQNHPLQIWEFSNPESINLGRSAENDIQISHPYVSRSHATIRRLEGETHWTLHVLSQNGVIIDGQKVRSATLLDGSIFQLASGGPFLRFMIVSSMESDTDINSTAHFDLDPSELLHLDTRQRDQEVQEITESPYFDQLQEKLKQLRKKDET